MEDGALASAAIASFADSHFSLLPAVSRPGLAVTGWAGLTEKLIVWSGAVLVGVQHGFDRAPALMLGLAVALAIPILAFAGFFTRWRRARGATGSRVGMALADVETVPASAWSGSGWFETDSGPGERFVIGSDLTRIGRADDNEVCLPHKTIHRYHAIVERSPEMQFTIVDTSGRAGNGIKVGGQQVARAQLRDGDSVEIGSLKLFFRLGEARTGGMGDAGRCVGSGRRR
jgi:hypothetical protein